MTSTPINARARFTYVEGGRAQSVLGVNPTATPVQFLSFSAALENIQAPTIQDSFLISEHQLED